MKINKSFFHTLFFILFIYSGMIKWLPWPVDPTLLFALCLSVSSLFYLRVLSKEESRVTINLFIGMLFFLWMLFGVSYTSSQTFVWEKVQGFVLAIIAFIIPIFTMAKEKYLISFRQAFNVIWVFALIILVLAYLQNGLVYVTGAVILEDSKYPDYLVVGEFLGLGIILNFNNSNKRVMVMKIISLAIMISIGGRGPILFLLLVYLIYAYYKYDFGRVKLSGLFATCVFVGGIVYIGFFSSFGSLTMMRFVKAAESSEDDKSLVDRFLAWNHALDMIQSNPLAGVGFGAFGIEAYGVDENEYPHNILLEVAAEGGLVGLTLIVWLLFAIFRPRWNWIKEGHLGAMFLLVGFFFITQYLKANGLIDSRRIFWVLGVILAYHRALIWKAHHQVSLVINNEISQLKTI